MAEQWDDLIGFARKRASSSNLVKDYPTAWQKLWESIYSISRDFGINIDVSFEVFKLAYECLSKEEEKRAVSTGFLVGDLKKFKEILSFSSGIRMEAINIFEGATFIRRLFGLIDGYESVFLIDQNGMLDSARLMPSAVKVPDEQNFSSYEFFGHCESVKEVYGYCLVTLGSLKTMKLFYNGSLNAEVYFSGKTGEWIYRPIITFVEKLDQIALSLKIDRRILYKILGIAIVMSNHRKGGTILLGDHIQILKQSEDPRFKLTGINILDLKGFQEQFLYNLSTQEFAFLISRVGEAIASSVRLLAVVPKTKTLEIAATDGGRHRSAAEISASSESVAFVVSDDGPITVYFDGKRIIRV